MSNYFDLLFPLRYSMISLYMYAIIWLNANQMIDIDTKTYRIQAVTVFFLFFNGNFFCQTSALSCLSYFALLSYLKAKLRTYRSVISVLNIFLL